MINTIFKPTKDHWYVYFNFYGKTVSNIELFLEELYNHYPFILGNVQNFSFGSCEVLIYVESEQKCEELKTDTTLKLYQKHVKEAGEAYNVF